MRPFTPRSNSVIRTNGRAVTGVFAALAVVVSGSHAAAATATWSGGGANNLWSTAANWSTPIGTTGTHALTFTGSTKLLNLSDNNYTLTSLAFAPSAGAFTIGGTGATVTNRTINMRGDIVNASANVQTIGSTVAGQRLLVNYGTSGGSYAIDTGSAGVVWNAQFVGNSNATIRKLGSGVLTINDQPTTSQNSFNGTFDLVSGTTNFAATMSTASTNTTIVNGANSVLNYSGKIAGSILNSGTLYSSGASGGLSNNTGAVATLSNASVGAFVNTGTVNVLGTGNNAASGDFTGGTINMLLPQDPAAAPNFAFNDLVNLGGALNLSLQGSYPGADLTNMDVHTFNLFSFYGGTQSDFSTVTASYAGENLTFAQNVATGLPDLWVSNEVSSGPLAGQYLTFDAATGNLVVVPEPSTVVFAGIGGAMAGWKVFKSRRLRRRTQWSNAEAAQHGLLV